MRRVSEVYLKTNNTYRGLVKCYHAFISVALTKSRDSNFLFAFRSTSSGFDSLVPYHIGATKPENQFGGVWG